MSTSRQVGQIPEMQMRGSDSYQEAYRRFKTYRPAAKVSAALRLTTEDVRERR